MNSRFLVAENISIFVQIVFPKTAIVKRIPLLEWKSSTSTQILVWQMDISNHSLENLYNLGLASIYRLDIKIDR